jgi:hypothetical protein
MEITSKVSSFEKIKELFLKDPKPFVKKREIHWIKVKITIGGGLMVLLFGVLFWPTTRPEETSFHEKTHSGTVVSAPLENDPTQETVGQLQATNVNTASVHSSLDYLYKENSASGIGGGGFAKSGSADRNGTMILSRGGNDAKTQLSPGTKFQVRLSEKMIVANQSMPIIGIVVKDVTQENEVAIPQGAKLIGDITFDDSSERAQINWRSIIMPEGHERPLSGFAVGGDGQVGLEGNVKTEALKNTMGKTLTRFIGAYAEGSMSKGQLGSSEGGHQNGVKNAIAETAKDRANSEALDISKEKKWIELQMGAEFYTVLNQPFLFRDPGATYGR